MENRLEWRASIHRGCLPRPMLKIAEFASATTEDGGRQSEKNVTSLVPKFQRDPWTSGQWCALFLVFGWLHLVPCHHHFAGWRLWNWSSEHIQTISSRYCASFHGQTLPLQCQNFTWCTEHPTCHSSSTAGPWVGGCCPRFVLGICHLPSVL